MNYFYTLFLYFFIYCILGWIAEVFFCRLVLGKWTNRGFLYGPYCPIYGFGGIIVVLFLEPFKINPILIFVLGTLLTTMLEYITSYILEKLFDAKWWDYSHIPLNINGRVCVFNSILFGILGLFATYIIHPHVQNIITKIPNSYLEYIFFIILLLLTIDLMATLNTLLNFKSKLKYLHEIKEKIKLKNNSYVQNNELIKQLEELKYEFIHKKHMLKNRLIHAFPDMTMNKFNESFEELKIAIHSYKLKKNKKDVSKSKK